MLGFGLDKYRRTLPYIVHAHVLVHMVYADSVDTLCLKPLYSAVMDCNSFSLSGVPSLFSPGDRGLREMQYHGDILGRYQRLSLATETVTTALEDEKDSLLCALNSKDIRQ